MANKIINENIDVNLKKNTEVNQFHQTTEYEIA